MALHNPQPLTQAIQDAPLEELTNEEAEQAYRLYLVERAKEKAYGLPYYIAPFYQWLTVNRVRIL